MKVPIPADRVRCHLIAVFAAALATFALAFAPSALGAKPSLDHPTATWAAGGIVSTAPDLLKAARMFGAGGPAAN